MVSTMNSGPKTPTTGKELGGRVQHKTSALEAHALSPVRTALAARQGRVSVRVCYASRYHRHGHDEHRNLAHILSHPDPVVCARSIATQLPEPPDADNQAPRITFSDERIAADSAPSAGQYASIVFDTSVAIDGP
jgi:hypothetical protein